MRHQWVGGQWLKSNRDRISVVNPATEEIIDHIPRGTVADADKAVQAAREALKIWRWMPAVGAHAVAGYAYYDTVQVGQTALEFFSKDIDAP